MAILYVFAQLIGATLGFRLLKALTPTKVFALSSGTYGVCQTAPHADLTEFDAFLIEFIATSVLISICCALWDPRNNTKQDSVPIKFGLAITILSVIFVSNHLQHLAFSSFQFLDFTILVFMNSVSFSGPVYRLLDEPR